MKVFPCSACKRCYHALDLFVVSYCTCCICEICVQKGDITSFWECPRCKKQYAHVKGMSLEELLTLQEATYGVRPSMQKPLTSLDLFLNQIRKL